MLQMPLSEQPPALYETGGKSAKTLKRGWEGFVVLLLLEMTLL